MKLFHKKFVSPVCPVIRPISVTLQAVEGVFSHNRALAYSRRSRHLAQSFPKAIISNRNRPLLELIFKAAALQY